MMTVTTVIVIKKRKRPKNHQKVTRIVSMIRKNQRREGIHQVRTVRVIVMRRAAARKRTKRSKKKSKRVKVVAATMLG